MNGAKKMLLGTSSNKRLYKKIVINVLILLILSSLFACSKEEKSLDLEGHFLEINNEVILTNEIMVYMYQVIEEFQNIGGEEVWEFEDFSGGKSATEVAKDAIIENIIRMKVLNDKSVELNVLLTNEEADQVKERAANYLRDMNPGFISRNNISIELMEELFYEFAVAEKVVEHITNDYIPDPELVNEKMLENEEYSRLKEYEILDLLTEYDVSHILLQTRQKDQNDEYVMLTESEKDLKYNLALEIHEKAKAGEDFTSLMINNSEEAFEVDSKENGNYQFSKALLPEQFKEGLIDLEVGQISDIIESEVGYHIFRVNNIKIPSEEEKLSFKENLVLYLEDLRLSVIEDLKKEAFNELYFKWKESVNISLDRDAWDKMDLDI